MALLTAQRIPRSTYRVQLHQKFTFDELRDLAPYLRELGISDYYLSPIFTSTPGSEHGYDVSDYREINPELGGQVGFNRLATTAQQENAGILLDFVPNHMGIHGPFNPWWRDVLELGRSSPFAPFFDIQWRGLTEDGDGRRRVITPVLEDHYGRVLEQGKIVLRFEDEFVLRIGETVMPVDPLSYRFILPLRAPAENASAEQGEWDALVTSIEALPVVEARHDMAAAKRRATKIGALKKELAALLGRSPALREKIDGQLEEINGTVGRPESFDRLHEFIERQHYRFTRWKAGAHEINYRRFFAIDSLVGLRVENPEVFRESHGLLRQILREGKVTGVRIDHIDGLRLPEDYLQRLQTLNAPENTAPLYTVVEKILARGETLPDAWPVHGTTGYEFIAQLSGLMVDATAEPAFRAAYQRFTGDHVAYADAVYGNKRIIVAEMFADVVHHLGANLSEIVEGDRLWRDLTRHELTNALGELLACLTTYRTYRHGSELLTRAERRVVEAAWELALRRNPRADPEPFTFLRDLLTGDYPSSGLPAEYAEKLMKWVLTFQQYTGAIMAKSVEDTTFYTFGRFIALNEVGGDPEFFGGTVEAFHEENVQRLRRNPHGLIATSTHDTKLSEDVRARLYALSELGGEWERAIAGWHALNARHVTVLEDREAPDAIDEYRFYQVLLGAWPLAAEAGDEGLRERLRAHLRKAVSEAKRHTSVLHPNNAYFEACDRFVDAVTNPATAGAFLDSFTPWAARIARLGMVNALAQVVLKCTVPGVPDIYQGNEVWDFSLVDPDNRRPVDFGLRQRLLAGIGARTPRELLENWRDGGIKLWVTRTLLRFRAEHADLFASGAYVAATSQGPFADRVVAFTRTQGTSSLLVVVPRLTAALGAPPLGLVWDCTRVAPTGVAATWRNLFTGERVEDGALFVRTLLAELPFAVLERLPAAAEGALEGTV